MDLSGAIQIPEMKVEPTDPQPCSSSALGTSDNEPASTTEPIPAAPTTSSAASSLASLLVQLGEEDGKPKLLCHVCQKSLFSLNSYIKHIKKHDPPGGFVCNYCQERFCMQEALNAHHEEKHKVLACRICKATFDKADDYQSHIVQEHDGIDRALSECEKCSAKFKTKESLKRHIATQCGTVKSHKCDQCEAVFFTKYNLQAHKALHGESKFCCSYCGKNFSQKGRLVIHERQHTGEKPYQCDVCQKSFAHRESLVTHSTLHTGIKPVVCKCCASRFSCHSNLIKHRRARPDTCGLPEYDVDKTVRRKSVVPRIPPTLMKSEIKISKSSKIVRPDHKATRAPKAEKPRTSKPRAKKVQKDSSSGSEGVSSSDEDEVKYDDDDDDIDEDEDDENDAFDEVPIALEEDSDENMAELKSKVIVEMAEPDDAAISETKPLTTRKAAVKKNNTPKDDFGVFNDLPDFHGVDCDDSDFSDNEPLVNANGKSSTKTSIPNPVKNSVKEEKDDFDVSIFNEKDEILNNFLDGPQFADAEIKLEPICKIEIPEASHFNAMIDPLGNQPPSDGPPDVKPLQVDLQDTLNGKSEEAAPLESKETEEVAKNGRGSRRSRPVIKPVPKPKKKRKASSSSDDEFLSAPSGAANFDSDQTSDDPSSDESFKPSPPKSKGRTRAKKTDGEKTPKAKRERATKVKKETGEPKPPKVPGERKPRNRGSVLKKIKELKKLQGRSRAYECKEDGCVKIYHFRGVYEKHLRHDHGRDEQYIYDLLKDDMLNIPENLGSKCPVCGKFYVMEKRLRTHVAYHGPDGTLIHKCPCYCNRYFLTKDEAFGHAKLDHKHQIYCEPCDRYLQNPEALSTHRKSYHEGKRGSLIAKERNLVCGQCGKRFISRTYLDNHERSDCGRNPIYKCNVCGKGFSTSGILKTHSLLHRDETPFICHMCGKAFKVQSQYKTHLRIRHTDEKPFKCELCPKAYPYRESLLTHMTVHTGFKRYKCNGCGSRYSCISNLQAHRKVHANTCGQLPLDSKPSEYMGVVKGQLLSGVKPNS